MVDKQADSWVGLFMLSQGGFMRIKSRPLIIASAAGFTVLLIWQVIGVIKTLDNLSELDFTQPMQATPLEYVLSCLLLMALGGVYVAVGGLYAWLHARAGAIKAESGLVGGAISGAIASIAQAIVSAWGSWQITPVIMEQVMGQAMPPVPDMPPEFTDLMTTMTTASTVFGIAISACMIMAIGTTLSALGGVVTATLLARRSRIT